MKDILYQVKNRVGIITLNRSAKKNAFDDSLLSQLQSILDEAINDDNVEVLLLNASGAHFSAGADIAWMQRMGELSESENHQDAMVLARVMFTLHHCPKPTVTAVQGAAFGGGVGLVAACDIAIATPTTRFCFSEIKLGLIPAVISPYVIKALGERTARWLFLSAEPFDGIQARQWNMVQYCVEENLLAEFSMNYAQKLAEMPPEALLSCKKLSFDVANQDITPELMQRTAALIAEKRVSAEGQLGLCAFLNKEKPDWKRKSHV